MSLNLGKRKSKRRGSILLLAIFFLIVLFSLSVTFFRIIPAEFHSATQARREVQAQFAADAGIRRGVDWLEAHNTAIVTQDELDTFNAANDDGNLATNKVDDDWSYATELSVAPDGFYLRTFTVTSRAYFHGREIRTAISTVQNESFAKFALFYDHWGSSLIYTMTPNGIQGPVHTNDYFNVSVPSKDYWTATKVVDGKTVSQDPWVSGPLAQMTHAGSFTGGTYGGAGDGNSYRGGNYAGNNGDLVPFTETGSPMAERYKMVVNGGREKVRQVQEITLPSENATLRDKTWGNGTIPDTAALKTMVQTKGNLLVQTDSGSPNTAGAKVTGGILITGGSDAQDVQLQLTDEGHQKTKVHQGDISVPGPASKTYSIPEEHFKYPYQKPDDPIYKTVCDVKGTRKKDVTEKYDCSYYKTEQNGAKCGYETQYIPGEGGINTEIQVAKTCTFKVAKTCTRVIGQVDEEYCVSSHQEQTGVKKYPVDWKDTTDGTIAGAVSTGFVDKDITTDYKNNPSAYPNAVEKVTETTQSVANWNSVVEVNETSYKIPFPSGTGQTIKVNGEIITNSNDTRLTIKPGSTVVIKNDGVSDGNGKRIDEVTTMEGSINGIVYSDENLYGLRGTSKGSYYNNGKTTDYHGKLIATSLGTDSADHKDGKNIEIQDSLLQYYSGNGTYKDKDGKTQSLNDGANRLAVGATSPNHQHLLGLVSTNIDVKPTGNASAYQNSGTTKRQTDFLGGSFKGGITVDAVLMAGLKYKNTAGTEFTIGGFGAHSTAMESGDGVGDFNLYGGIISALARQTQTGFAAKGKTAAYNTGFRLGLNYDEVAAQNLENFPITNNYTVLRYVTYMNGSTFDPKN